MRSDFGFRMISVLWLACCGVTLAETAPLELRNDKIAVRLGQEERGGIISLKTGGGIELVAIQKAPRLFALTFSQKAEIPGEKVMLSNGDATVFNAAVQDEAGGRCATLTYEGFSKGVARVVCTARVKPDDPQVHWGITVQMQEGWVLETVQ